MQEHEIGIILGQIRLLWNQLPKEDQIALLVSLNGNTGALEQWEYKVTHDYKRDHIVEYLNTLGQQGWELCAIEDEYYYWKRKITGL